MSYSSRIDIRAHWVRDGAKWFLFRLSIYVAVAVISAGLFFVGVAVYAFPSLPAYVAFAIAVTVIAVLSRFRRRRKPGSKRTSNASSM